MELNSANCKLSVRKYLFYYSPLFSLIFVYKFTSDNINTGKVWRLILNIDIMGLVLLFGMRTIYDIFGHFDELGLRNYPQYN